MASFFRDFSFELSTFFTIFLDLALFLLDLWLLELFDLDFLVDGVDFFLYDRFFPISFKGSIGRSSSSSSSPDVYESVDDASDGSEDDELRELRDPSSDPVEEGEDSTFLLLVAAGFLGPIDVTQLSDAFFFLAAVDAVGAFLFGGTLMSGAFRVGDDGAGSTSSTRSRRGGGEERRGGDWGT